MRVDLVQAHDHAVDEGGDGLRVLVDLLLQHVHRRIGIRTELFRHVVERLVPDALANALGQHRLATAAICAWPVFTAARMPGVVVSSRSRLLVLEPPDRQHVARDRIGRAAEEARRQHLAFGIGRELASFGPLPVAATR